MQSKMEQPLASATAAAEGSAGSADVIAAAGAVDEQVEPTGPADPLPSAEEIAAATAAADTAKASSAMNEPKAQPPLKGLGKGLGGAGLGSRKGKANGGGSTISAATAPAALAVRNKKGASGAGAAASSSAAAGAAPNDPVGSSNAQGRKPVSAAAAVSTSSSRTLSKGTAESFNLNMTTDAVDDDESGDWESASTDEEVFQQLLDVASGHSPKAASSISRRGPKTWQQELYGMFDETTLVVCGSVLGLCAGSLLLLGGKVYLDRQR